MTVLDEILRKLRFTATFRWGRVTGLDPLMVQLDGDSAPLRPSDTLLDPTAIQVGDRVRCEMSMLRVVVHARADAATDARAGVVRLATQAEADDGTEPSAVLTAATGRGREYAPFAVAAGTGTSTGTISAGAGETVAIVFPAGRFTQPPLVTVTTTLSARVNPAVLNVTASGCDVRLDNWSDGAAGGAQPFAWIAVQMTADTAAG